MDYRAELDGLRAIAVLGVVLFHAEIIPGGYLGVDIFFVISGYLITNIVLSGIQTQTFSLREFYKRRAKRIIPALIALILCCMPISWILMPRHDQQDFYQSICAIAFFVSNIFFWIKINFFNRDIQHLPLVHTWSIAIEEQFYLLLPLLMKYLWTYSKKYILLVFTALFAASLLLAQKISISHQIANYYLLPSRVWELMFGCILAYLELKRGRSNDAILISLMPSFGLLWIIYSLLTFRPESMHPGLITLIPVIGTGLIIWFGDHENLGTWILRLNPLVNLGIISYSVYLVHYPILVYIRFMNNMQLSIISIGIYITLTLGFAYILWRHIEQPFRSFKGRMPALQQTFN